MYDLPIQMKKHEGGKTVNYLSVNSSQETQALATELAKVLQPGAVVLLEGPLGSGKTTFTQGLGKALGIKRAIKSPTYTIVKEYSIDGESPLELIHIDAYRLETGGADSIDLHSFLRPDTVVFIEWSQYIADYLPETYIKIEFIPQNELTKRQIEISVHGEKEADTYEQLVAKWMRNWERNEAKNAFV